MDRNRFIRRSCVLDTLATLSAGLSPAVSTKSERRSFAVPSWTSLRNKSISCWHRPDFDTAESGVNTNLRCATPLRLGDSAKAAPNRGQIFFFLRFVSCHFNIWRWHDVLVPWRAFRIRQLDNGLVPKYLWGIKQRKWNLIVTAWSWRRGRSVRMVQIFHAHTNPPEKAEKWKIKKEKRMGNIQQSRWTTAWLPWHTSPWSIWITKTL